MTRLKIGKLHIPIGFENIIRLTRKAGIAMVPVRNAHIRKYQTLEVKDAHKDPFDRFIISVALHEQMAILSDDGKFDLYSGVRRIWQP